MSPRPKIPAEACRFDGLKFADDLEPRAKIRRFLCGRKPESIEAPTPLQRYKINLIVTLKAYLFFNEFRALEDFWPSLAHTLCEHWTGPILQETVNLYISARELYIRDVEEAIITPPDQISRLLDACISVKTTDHLLRAIDEEAGQAFQLKQNLWPKHLLSFLASSRKPTVKKSLSIKGLASKKNGEVSEKQGKEVARDNGTDDENAIASRLFPLNALLGAAQDSKPKATPKPSTNTSEPPSNSRKRSSTLFEPSPYFNPVPPRKRLATGGTPSPREDRKHHTGFVSSSSVNHNENAEEHGGHDQQLRKATEEATATTSNQSSIDSADEVKSFKATIPDLQEKAGAQEVTLGRPNGGPDLSVLQKTMQAQDATLKELKSDFDKIRDQRQMLNERLERLEERHRGPLAWLTGLFDA
ncbi:uncharacterized protein F4822DRAFT_428728 [Hypoxylon trugodes]|uniref:uncharacterized protein n=1 Tax=Hypoxylon trugodes TaxID=326681 RepID=UPI0021954803|nr:uncharacterized protein F4822DRAFT_428728 [Hypoxylon trugodes]KAI1390391.1 hypothetical protein F4822DRAFT_428728 [Hypoxylon trugodes]